ncbi:MAG: hypothetical protein MJZ83_04665 [Bacteroidaceae bacterium]|nr:hypothetical protein [Bacteroidaceae bacterium]
MKKNRISGLIIALIVWGFIIYCIKQVIETAQTKQEGPAVEPSDEENQPANDENIANAVTGNAEEADHLQQQQ